MFCWMKESPAVCGVSGGRAIMTREELEMKQQETIAERRCRERMKALYDIAHYSWRLVIERNLKELENNGFFSRHIIGKYNISVKLVA